MIAFAIILKKTSGHINFLAFFLTLLAFMARQAKYKNS